MEDKFCVVTGASSGIGKVTAKAFARQGAKVILVCRNKGRGEAALKEIKEITKNSNLELILTDFSSIKEIEKLASEIQLKFPRIDVLVNNAGVIIDKRILTDDGIETTFAVNHLGYFYLTNLLLKNLKAAPKARIVNVASEAARMGRIDFDNLNFSYGYSPMKAYCQSKLANILFTFELARRLKGTNVTTNCLHPGIVRTNFGKDLSGFTKTLFSITIPFMRTPEKGAETVIWLASSSDVENVSGKYFHDKKEIKGPTLSCDIKLAKRLWEVSEKMTNLKYDPINK